MEPAAQEDLVPAMAEELVHEASKTPGGATLYGVHAQVHRGVWTITDADDRQDIARSKWTAIVSAISAIRRGAR
jgi:hypothetical protein